MCSQNLETASTYCARLVLNLFMQCSSSTKFCMYICICIGHFVFLLAEKFHPRWTQLLSPANGSTPSTSLVNLNGSEKWKGSFAEIVKSQRRWIPSKVDLQGTKHHNENNHIPKGRKISGTTDPIQVVQFHGKQNGRECGLLIHSTTLEDQGTWRWEC